VLRSGHELLSRLIALAGLAKYAWPVLLVALAGLDTGGCAHTLRDAPFSVVVHEDAMVEIDVDALALEPNSEGAPVQFIQIPLPPGWDRSLHGWSRPPLRMPPSLQPENLARIQSDCAMMAATVVRLHGGVGGGWPAYERILRRYAEARGASLVVLAGMASMSRSTRTGATGRNLSVAAITFVGDPARASCLYEALGSPTVEESLGSLGCARLEKIGNPPTWCQ
jgi:hypothetical protein